MWLLHCSLSISCAVLLGEWLISEWQASAGLVWQTWKSHQWVPMETVSCYKLNNWFHLQTLSQSPIQLPASLLFLRQEVQSINDTMLVWDTGASIDLTLFCSDFIDYQPLDDITVKDISWENTVLEIGTGMWKYKSRQCNEVLIPAVSYHMPECNNCLQSPKN